jgi:hypothetical protein
MPPRIIRQLGRAGIGAVQLIVDLDALPDVTGIEMPFLARCID